MREAIKHGQTLTMSPNVDPADIQIGDIVLVKWHQGDIFHVVGDVHRVLYFIDCGKECVGLASEIFALFEYSDSD
jgi:hypothetical protein